MTLDEVKELERKAYMEGDSTVHKLCLELLKQREIVRELEYFIDDVRGQHALDDE